MSYEESFDGFEFSAAFDRQFLDDLYGGDTEAAEEIFASSLLQVQQELRDVEERAVRGDVEGIRRIFHKIKPLFGYMGLLSVQDYVQEFEDRCQQPATIQDIQVPLENIMGIVHAAISQVKQEHSKLKEFNNRRA